MVKFLCVIPSRIGSTRLARKPLALLAGKPMIQRTYEAAKKCAHFSEVVVATDSDEIADVIKNCGGTVVMTDANIQTGSDRVAFVARQYKDMDVIVNLQGDEPFVTENMLTALIGPYLNGERVNMATIANPLEESDYLSPDKVKVLIDQFDNALYFSRAPIPYLRDKDCNLADMPVYHHQGMYAFTREFLIKFTGLPPTPLELAEKLEQLRALEHGFTIRVCLTSDKTLEINTPEELAEAQTLAQQIWPK
jgi:3-deoxy-manno-octulosonate cytidylyltransferase (CMP-KDO synthetase)